MDKDEREIIAARRRTTMIWSLIVIALTTLAASMAARSGRKEEAFGLGDFSGEEAADYEERYLASGTAEDLICLLKVLSYQAEVEKNDKVAGEIKLYGTELLRRAKEKEIDLKELDDSDGTLLELLGIIRKYGAS